MGGAARPGARPASTCADARTQPRPAVATPALLPGHGDHEGGRVPGQATDQDPCGSKTEPRAREALVRISLTTICGTHVQGWRLNRMVEDLLDAARITAHRLQMDPRTTDVVSVVRTTVGSRGSMVTASSRCSTTCSRTQSSTARPTHRSRSSSRAANRRSSSPSSTRANRLATSSRSCSRASAARSKRAARRSRESVSVSTSARVLIEAHDGRIWAESNHGATAFRFTVPRPPE